MAVEKYQYSPRMRPFGEPQTVTTAPHGNDFSILRVQDRRRVFAAGWGDSASPPEQVIFTHLSESEGSVWRENEFAITSLIDEPVPLLFDIAIEGQFFGSFSAVGDAFTSGQENMYALGSDDDGESWQLRYRFKPQDYGHNAPDGFWFPTGKRTFPTLEHTYDIFTTTRRQDFFAGPHIGESWNLEPRLFIFKDGVLDQDIELPHEPFVSGEALGSHPLVVLSDFSPKYDTGYFVIQNMVSPYDDGDQQGGERIYKVTSAGVELATSMPESASFLANVNSIIVKPETSALLMARPNATYISFDDLQNFTQRTLTSTEFQGGTIQRKTDVISTAGINSKQSMSLMLGGEALDLPLDGLGGQTQWESTRSWRRQARGLVASTDMRQRRLY